ncbi:sigma-70 family RNA polymerase sigma factor [Fodinibius saliphilus]|uniref:sigma-70 family RNA polymerase sigma factor n=1 Tax=Fodinibius saliphilus TaxID=1920650 RepID=UPI001FECC437|nr:sigma-70 family RNA polymerase sigma factor [Fodinibius saliphilus]
MFIFNLLATIGKVAHGNSDDEVQLMKRIQSRDAYALEELYELYERLLFSMVLSIVKKREEAEDLLQEIFVKIWKKAESFDPERGNVYSWIVTVARNKAIDRIRSKGYKTQKKQSVSIHEPLFSLEGDKYDPMETTIFSDRAELVKKALDKIPEKQSEVIKIAYYRGMTQSEISDHLDIPLGTVKTRTRQGMIKLKRILGEFISTDG